MKKTLALFLAVTLLVTLAACGGSKAETLTGKADGFGGVVTVTVTREGGKITAVKVDAPNETAGVAGPAIEQLPGKMVSANSTAVDMVSGATVTSTAIIAAANNAIDPAKFPYTPKGEAPASKPTEAVSTASVYQGIGLSNAGRIGPGKDSTDTQVYSFNQIAANVLFDADGKILAINIDQLEVATPNYDGESMPHFSGFPGQGGYNNDENHDGTVDGKTEVDNDSFLAEVASWKTKRERGDSYVMGTGTWSRQMNTFEALFVGKTADEIGDWFAKYCSNVNGRPLKDGSSNDADKAKYDALSADEKAMLADVTASATMSLNDSHGNIIAAIEKAYENRRPLDIKGAKAMGIGTFNSGRIGPGKDNTDTQVYSINQIFANTLFDADGRIVAIYVDQLEYATPNYDGETMPHFYGFPGQEGYNNDENHDGTVDGQFVPTEESFMADFAGMLSKRDRGAGYVMGTGTWTNQIDKFEEIFVGKTVDEVETWFEKYCSNVNGRPLKDGSTNDADKAKYDALSADEKAMLADVTASATMSLNDSHGNIVAAIRKSFENKATIDLTVG